MLDQLANTLEQRVWDHMTERFRRAFRECDQELLEQFKWFSNALSDVARTGRISRATEREARRTFRDFFTDWEDVPEVPRSENGKDDAVSVSNAEVIADLIYNLAVTVHSGFAEERAWLGLPLDPQIASDVVLEALINSANLELASSPDRDGRSRRTMRYLNEVPSGVLIQGHLEVGPLCVAPFGRIAFFQQGGTLKKLRDRAQSVARTFRTSEGDALAMMLAGFKPRYESFRIGIQKGSAFTVYGDWIPRRVSRLDRIVIEVDPSLSGNEVRRLYERTRAQLSESIDAEGVKTRQDKPITAYRNLLLAKYYSNANRPREEQAVLDEWNELAFTEEIPEYKRFSDLRRDALRTIKVLLDPRRNQDDED